MEEQKQMTIYDILKQPMINKTIDKQKPKGPRIRGYIVQR